jgi:hypothetical protein
MNRNIITLVRSKEFVSDLAALIELEKEFMDHARSAGEDKDVFVLLQPDDVPLLKITWMKNHTERLGEGVIDVEHPTSSRSKVALIPHGQIFRAAVEVRPMKGKTKALTEFLPKECFPHA